MKCERKIHLYLYDFMRSEFSSLSIFIACHTLTHFPLTRPKTICVAGWTQMKRWWSHFNCTTFHPLTNLFGFGISSISQISWISPLISVMFHNWLSISWWEIWNEHAFNCIYSLINCMRPNWEKTEKLINNLCIHSLMCNDNSNKLPSPIHLHFIEVINWYNGIPYRPLIIQLSISLYN